MYASDPEHNLSAVPSPSPDTPPLWLVCTVHGLGSSAVAWLLLAIIWAEDAACTDRFYSTAEVAQSWIPSLIAAWSVPLFVHAYGRRFHPSHVWSRATVSAVLIPVAVYFLWHLAEMLGLDPSISPASNLALIAAMVGAVAAPVDVALHGALRVVWAWSRGEVDGDAS